MKEKEERVMPEPDRYAVCSPADTPILDFYRGVFESCFILLHPFLRPHSIPLSRFRPGSYPSKQELKRGTESVTWKYILHQTGLDQLSQVDVGLRTGIGGLKEEFANSEFDRELSKVEESEGLIRPSEGKLPEELQDELLSSIQQLSYRWIWIGDEFCSERKLHWIDDLKDHDFMPANGSFFTPDYKILVTTHWDSHFSLICSSRDTLTRIIEFGVFEGFYCGDDTEIYWSIRNKNIQQIG